MDIPFRSALVDPSPEELRELAAAQPSAQISEYGNVNVRTGVTARSKGSTFFVSDDPSRHTDASMSRDDYNALAKLQDEHLADKDVIVVNGYIGDHPEARVRTRLIIEKEFANIPAMQQLLYFPADDDAEPEFTVVYSPTLRATGYPDDRVIAVDLDNGVTRVANADYFGESKMGGLRMWDALMYRRGGLAMHSGLKVVGSGDARRAGLIVGLSGTGKTTTTFSKQGDSAPVQDDFIALFPGGRVYGTEAGTFAKVYGLTEEREPAVWHGIQQSRSYLENVAQDEEGRLDFFDRSHTENSRAVIAADDIPGMIMPAEVDTVDFMLILNRNASIIPAVAKLSREQAAAYFMLGETQGTSAGGKAEAGKFLRVPGTNPFFAYRHEYQANRFRELLDTTDLDVYLLNTGSVGGEETVEGAIDVTPAISSAIVAGIADGTIEWDTDPDFGYLVASSVPGIEDDGVLQPQKLYERTGRAYEYRAQVEQLVADRRAHLAKYPELLPEIVDAV